MGISKKDGAYELRYDTPEGGSTLRSRSVALTVPAFTAAKLLQVPPSHALTKSNQSTFLIDSVALIVLAFTAAKLLQVTVSRPSSNLPISAPY